MAYSIRLATEADIPTLMELYDSARRYMRQNGNLHQWTGGYPSESIVRQDIAVGHLFICSDGEETVGAFCFFEGIEPTYNVIDGGQWLNNRPYGVIHRIAVSAHRKGVASFCFAYAFAQCGNVRVDTHRDNIPMQKSLTKNGFTYCGVIYLADGAERLAYQKG